MKRLREKEELYEVDPRDSATIKNCLYNSLHYRGRNQFYKNVGLKDYIQITETQCVRAPNAVEIEEILNSCINAKGAVLTPCAGLADDAGITHKVLIKGFYGNNVDANVGIADMADGGAGYAVPVEWILIGWILTGLYNTEWLDLDEV